MGWCGSSGSPIYICGSEFNNFTIQSVHSHFYLSSIYINNGALHTAVILIQAMCCAAWQCSGTVHEIQNTNSAMHVVCLPCGAHARPHWNRVRNSDQVNPVSVPVWRAPMWQNLCWCSYLYHSGTQQNSYSISHLLGTVTSLWLDSDCVVTFDNCLQHVTWAENGSVFTVNSSENLHSTLILLHAVRLMTWLIGVQPAVDLSWKALV